MRKGLLILLSGNLNNTALFSLKCLKCQVLLSNCFDFIENVIGRFLFVQ